MISQLIQRSSQHNFQLLARFAATNLGLFLRGQNIDLPAEGTITLGRQKGNPHSVDIDLDEVSGGLLGISRIHAIIGVKTPMG